MNTSNVLALLSQEERASLLNGLIKREQESARSMAVIMAAALAANLKMAGRPDLAELVNEIETGLLKQGK